MRSGLKTLRARRFFSGWRITFGAVSLVGLTGLWCLAADANRRDGAENQEHMAAQRLPSLHVSGSAFAVGHNLVVTNAHVTMRCRAAGLPLTVAGISGWEIKAEDPQDELALLSGPDTLSLPSLPLSAAPQLPHGTAVMLMGYPLREGSFIRMQAVPGMISRAALTVHRPEAGTSVTFVAAGPDGETVEPRWADGLAYFGSDNAEKLRWILEIDAAAGHGDSGGPVLDGNGSVVGVVFAGSPEHHEASAVTLDDLRAFLLQADITPHFAPPSEQINPDWQRAVDHAAPSVFRVGC
jgi:S1-C subfamily serine protease